MFVLIENHSDKIDQICTMVGVYSDKGTAQTVMHQLYSDAHDRNSGYEPDMDYLEDDVARAWWSSGDYDFYDWNIFDTEGSTR